MRTLLRLVILFSCSLALTFGAFIGSAIASENQVNQQQIVNDKNWDLCPSWCNDGENILFVSDRLGGFGVWRVPVQGGKITQIAAADPGVVHLWPDMNPKTGEVVFASISTRSKFSQLFLVLPGKPLLTQITTMPSDMTYPRWSPDGKKIAFCSPNKVGTSFVWIMDSDGANLSQLVEGYQPCWSPDGSQLAFAKSTVGKMNWDIWTIRVDGNGLAQITREESHELQPDWSPDGRWLAYISIKDKPNAASRFRDILSGLKSSGKKCEIWVKDIADPNPSAIQVTSSAALNLQPRWSPNGTQVVYSSDGCSLNIWRTTGSLPKSAGAPSQPQLESGSAKATTALSSSEKPRGTGTSGTRTK